MKIDDLVISLGFETYAETVQRATFPTDLLVEVALAEWRAGTLAVADPWRSHLHQARVLLRRGNPAFPSAPDRVHVAPHRWRRGDAVDYDSAVEAARTYLGRVRRASPRGSALIVTHPVVAAAADPDEWGAVTYYAWDDWAAHPHMAAHRPAFERAYTAIAARGIRVAAVSSGIIDRIASPGPTLVVPNGLRESEWTEPIAAPSWYESTPSPRLLYSGTVDSRISLPHLAATARALPHGSVLVVGTLNRPGLTEELADLPNVTVMPWQTRDVIRGLTFHCDAALIPHVDSTLTRGMSPLKMYEYLAAGRPVVGTDLPVIRAQPGVRVADGPDDFAATVLDALAAGPAAEEDRLAFVQANGWRSRMTTLLDFATAP